jgi:hypothetical protein
MFYFHLNYSKTFKAVMSNSKLNPILTGVPQDWFMCQFHIPFFALTRKKKKGGSSLHNATSHWLHGNSIPKIGCHYFWPGLIALPKNTLPIKETS